MGNKRSTCWPFPLPQLFLFPHVISLPMGAFLAKEKERMMDKEPRKHCNLILLK